MKLARIALAVSVFWGVISGLCLIAAVVSWVGNLGPHRTPVVLAEYGAKFLLVAAIFWALHRISR
ncbi:hypothetical protein [Streptomyces sp. NPDC048282]|uniref:hypothetical protein n=1 Tax=Streptomyces sp. NPDC048282 TaxID=3365528 RepID=UPI003720723B